MSHRLVRGPQTQELPELSLEAIRAFATTEYSRAEMANRSIVLGVHNGTPVVADHPCRDICPDYTVRVVRYDVTLEECVDHGGTIISTFIPWALGRMVHEFCSPLGDLRQESE